MLERIFFVGLGWGNVVQATIYKTFIFGILSCEFKLVKGLILFFHPVEWNKKIVLSMAHWKGWIPKTLIEPDIHFEDANKI